MDDGIYEITGNGEIHVPFVRGLINRGSAECTVTVYRHVNGRADCPRDDALQDYTLDVGANDVPPKGRYPFRAGEPLIIEVLDFTP